MYRIGLILSLVIISVFISEGSIKGSALPFEEPQTKIGEKDEIMNRAQLGFSIAFGMPYVVAMSVSDSREMVVEAVYGATQLSGGAEYGRVVSTGTLLVKGYDDAQYLPTPTDRLVVKMDGYTHEFKVNDARGNNMAPNAASWLNEPHMLDYVHTLPGLAQAHVTVQFDGARFAVDIKGWYKYEGTRFEMNLSATGGGSGESDYHGQETKIKYGIKGKVKADKMEVTVDEQHASETASATNLRLLYSQRGSATRFNAVLNNTLKLDGKEYKLKNVQVQTDSKTKGGVSSFAITHLEGKVLENGKAYGQLVQMGDKVGLKTADGMIDLKLPVLEPEIKKN